MRTYAVLISGLMSVTFRPLSIERIVEIARDAKLSLIDWGGDIHVPHGDFEQARFARRTTLDAGLSIGSYASYYRLGSSEADGLSFASVLETTRELGASTVRVWAGRVGSDQITPDQRHAVIDDGRRCCDLARRAGVKITLEFHTNTLTDGADRSIELLREIDSDAMGILWQPFTALGTQARESELQTVLPRLAGLHVFHWTQAPNGPIVRETLESGRGEWSRYLRMIPSGVPVPAMLEFVRNDSPDQLIEDARVLNELIAQMR